MLARALNATVEPSIVSPRRATHEPMTAGGTDRGSTHQVLPRLLAAAVLGVALQCGTLTNDGVDGGLRVRVDVRDPAQGRDIASNGIHEVAVGSDTKDAWIEAQGQGGEEAQRQVGQ